MKPEQIKHLNNNYNKITLKTLHRDSSHGIHVVFLSCRLSSVQPQHPNASASILITRPAGDQQIKALHRLRPTQHGSSARERGSPDPTSGPPAIRPQKPHYPISQSFQTTISFYLELQKIKLTSPVPDVTFFISPTQRLLKRSRQQHQGSTSTLSFQGEESSHLPKVTEAPEAIRLFTSSGQTLPFLTGPPAPRSGSASQWLIQSPVTPSLLGASDFHLIWW